MLLHVYYCLSHLCILFVWFVWVLLCGYVECHRPTCNQPFRIMYNGVKTTILPIGTSIIFNCWVLWPFPALIWFGYGCLCLHAHIDIYLCCLNGLNFRALASAVWRKIQPHFWNLCWRILNLYSVKGLWPLKVLHWYRLFAARRTIFDSSCCNHATGLNQAQNGLRCTNEAVSVLH